MRLCFSISKSSGPWSGVSPNLTMCCVGLPQPDTRWCPLQSRTIQLTRLHADLRQAVFGRHQQRSHAALPLRTPLNVACLLRLWDYEAGLGLQVCSHPAHTRAPPRRVQQHVAVPD